MNRVRVLEIQIYERPVHFRMPFRFGVITLTDEPQVFVRALIEVDAKRVQWGQAAEALVPKWFDKSLALSHEENFAQLRTSLSIAAQLYCSEKEPKPAFDLSSENSAPQYGACRQRNLNGLIAGLGSALLDRAILDALCRSLGLSFFECIRLNVPAIRVLPEMPELGRFPLAAFLADLRPLDRIHARHTIGMLDPLTGEEQRERVADGLPETLEEVIRFYGNTFFKIKLSGDSAQDVERLKSIARILEATDRKYTITLDGNEQYSGSDEVLDLWAWAEREPVLRNFLDSVVLIEQPISRNAALEQDVSRLDAKCPVMIDESDADLDAFPRAKYCGYSAVSSKQCKGIYRAIINAARCRHWNQDLPRPRYFMTGEDLTIQPGVALQQDLALAALLGLNHIERNGHHYVRGFTGVSPVEQEAFLQNHPDLYTQETGFVRLHIAEGCLPISSMNIPALGTAVFADWSAMQRIR